jgi:hypothetical protein
VTLPPAVAASGGAFEVYVHERAPQQRLLVCTTERMVHVAHSQGEHGPGPLPVRCVLCLRHAPWPAPSPRMYTLTLAARRYAVGLYRPSEGSLVVADAPLFALTSHVRALLPTTAAAAPTMQAAAGVRRSVRALPGVHAARASLSDTRLYASLSLSTCVWLGGGPKMAARNLLGETFGTRKLAQQIRTQARTQVDASALAPMEHLLGARLDAQAALVGPSEGARTAVLLCVREEGGDGARVCLIIRAHACVRVCVSVLCV